MNKLNKYTIPYTELSLGKHHFEMQIESAFFAQFEFSEITDSKVMVEIEAEKTNYILRLMLQINGEVSLPCDRCLDYYWETISVNQSVLVKTTQEEEANFEGEEEVIYLSANESAIDLSQFIYETICLDLPLQRLHYDDEKGNSTCNKVMLEKLKSLQPSTENKSEVWRKIKEFETLI
ncbi:MAG: YceD family protein [Bacteroidales bacterium]